jgi:branched-chain amino acid transport system permease protein
MVRASAEDALAAEHVGIRVTRVASLTFVVGSALAAWAGCLLAILYPVSAGSGGTYLIKGFSVALLGGLGSVNGGVVAAFILGLAEQLGAGYWEPSWVPGLSGLLIIAVLLVRPAGLFGRAQGSTEVRESFLPPPVALPRRMWWLTVAALGAAFFVPSLGLSYQARSLAAFAVLYAILASAVGFLFRLTGVLSFGHGAFFALGAYGSALAVQKWGISFWLVLPMMAAISGVVGALIGHPILRTAGFYFVIVTFAIADLMALLLTNLDNVTNGTQGLTLIASPTGFLGLDFTTADGMYRLLVAFLCLTMLVIWLVERSRFGQRLLALRDNAVLARSLGLHVHSHAVLAFAISGAIAGAGGVLFLYQNSALNPSLFAGFATVSLPLMVILGGSRIPAGALIGSVVLTFLPYWLNFGPAGTQYAQGAALIVLMLAMPEGLGPGAVRLVRAARRIAGGRPPALPTAPQPADSMKPQESATPPAPRSDRVGV